MSEISDKYMMAPIKESRLRWIVLLMLCILVYSFMYCFNNPFAIQQPLEDVYGLSSIQYSWLYSIYSYPNAIIPFISAIIIDFFGVYTSSLLFYFIIMIGQTIWIMSFIDDGSYTFMLIGRGLFGCGTETFHTARKIILFDYFKGKEYSLASGISLSLSRIASATQSNISPYLYNKYNSIIVVLSIGTVLVYISFILLIMFVIYIKCKNKLIYNSNNNQEIAPMLTKSNRYIEKKGEIHLSAIWTNKFDKRVLFLGFALCTFYDSYLTFSTIGSAYIQFQYKYTYEISSNLMSIPYYTAAVLTPIFGFIVDRYGHRCQLLFISAIFMLFGHLILGYSNINVILINDNYYLIPIIALIFLGLAFSIFAAIVWPSFALIVERKYLATALGIVGSLDNGLRATLFVIVGLLTKQQSDNNDNIDNKYEYVTYFYLFLSINNFIWVALLWYYDKYHFGDVLNCKESKFIKNKKKAKNEKVDENEYIDLSHHPSMDGKSYKHGYDHNNLTVDINDCGNNNEGVTELTHNNK